MNFITSILEQGLIYGILALGIYITYKILDFPDLTVDGSFPLGAAITAALLTRGMNPYITLILSFFPDPIPSESAVQPTSCNTHSYRNSNSGRKL